VTVLAVAVMRCILPQAMKQQLIDKYTNKTIYSGCQAPVIVLFVTFKASCKTRNTLWAQNIDSGEKGEKLILCWCFVYVQVCTGMLQAQTTLQTDRYERC
jgi:hypothetical protein